MPGSEAILGKCVGALLATSSADKATHATIACLHLEMEAFTSFRSSSTDVLPALRCMNPSPVYESYS